MTSRKINVVLSVSLILAVVIAGGIYFWSKSGTNQSPTTSTSNEPISYSTNGVDVSLTKITSSFDYTVDQLTSQAIECGSSHETGYFDELVAQFSDANKLTYSFKYLESSQDPNTYTVTLLPNKAGYQTLDQFNNDFGFCAAGGDAYPFLVNNDWLLFVKSCGTGFDDDSGRPNGCAAVKAIVEPSLKLN